MLSGLGPEDVTALGLRAFRVVFGVLLAVATARYFWTGRIHRQFIEPSTFFTYLGFDWVRPLPPVWMYVLFAGLSVLGVVLASGYAYRFATGALAVGITYIHLIDKTAYLNHYYLISLVLFILWTLPLGRTGPDRLSRRALWWLRVQVGVVYVMAGVAKWHRDWLLEGEPLRTWLMHRQGALSLPDVLVTRGGAIAMSWAGMLFDVMVVPLLMVRRTRVIAFVVAVLFHLLTAVLFPIGVFPFAMVVALTVFLEPEWPRRFARTHLGVQLLGHAPRGRGGGAWLRTRVGAAFILLWCGVQIVVPLRHHLYPGDDHWTEEAFRFSWKVMLVEKYGAATFTIVDPVTGEGREVDPAHELTPIQVRMMAHQPDMLLQYAHRLRDLHVEATGRTPQVFCHARVKWNARPSERLVDPSVDLAQQPRGFAPKTWILPAP